MAINDGAALALAEQQAARNEQLTLIRQRLASEGLQDVKNRIQMEAPPIRVTSLPGAGGVPSAPSSVPSASAPKYTMVQTNPVMNAQTVPLTAKELADLDGQEPGWWDKTKAWFSDEQNQKNLAMAAGVIGNQIAPNNPLAAAGNMAVEGLKAEKQPGRRRSILRVWGWMSSIKR